MKPALAKVGPAWDGSDIETWPGVAGIDGSSNHLEQNTNPFLPDPENTSITHDENMRMNGGKRRKTMRRKGKKGKQNKKGKKTKRGKKSKKSKSTKKHTKRRYRGGSHHGNTVLPQSLVNLGRNLQYNIEGAYSSFMGAQPPVNPDPQVQPIGLR